MTGILLALAAAWLAAAGVYRVLSLRAVDRRLAEPAEDPGPVPPSGEVVALRPLKGARRWLELCLDSLWTAAAGTGTRVILGVADPDDPAVDVVRGAMAAAEERPPTELRIDPGPPGLNRKMANLLQMTQGVHADILAFSDADVRVPPDYIDRAVRPFKDTDVGLATFPYRSIPCETVASRLDALITNAHFLPSVAMALQVQGLHFGLGASLVVRREALEKAGGLEALLPVSGDDYWMARHIEDAGYRLAFVPLMLDHMLEDEELGACARRHVRWNAVVREQRPLGYFGQIVTHGAAAALAVAGLGALAGLGAAVWLAPLAWWAGETWGLARRRRILGLARRDLALVPLAGVAAFGLWLAGYLGRPRPS